MLFDEEMMLLAIEQAKKAAALGECPVGAIIIDKDEKIIATGYNLRETKQSPILHAEIVAIEEAARFLNNRRLSGCTLYVTLEPCPMCAGAIINSGLRRLVYGAFDENGGACSSVVNLFDYPFCHKPLVRSRILEKECGALMSEFFARLRQENHSPQSSSGE